MPPVYSSSKSLENGVIHRHKNERQAFVFFFDLSPNPSPKKVFWRGESKG